MTEENDSFNFANLFLQRPVEQAIKELRDCETRMEIVLELVASACPGTVGIGAIVTGKVRGVFVLAASVEGDHVSPVSLSRMQGLARIIGNHPTELRAAFEAELAKIPLRESSLHYVTPEQIAADDAARSAEPKQ